MQRNVRYMFSMDMTGEDVTKTGGSFLIERWPDPGAVWRSAVGSAHGVGPRATFAPNSSKAI